MTAYGERISDNRLYLKLVNHNAWTNGTFLDINGLGAGGSNNHLILANTQTKIGDLMPNSKLWDLIDSIGVYEAANGLQREEPIKEIMDEYSRLDKGGKYNHYFMSDFIRKNNVREMTPIKGADF